MTIEKGVKKLVYGYEKFTGRNFIVGKTPGDPGKTLCKRKLEETTDMYSYRLFMGKVE